MTTLRSDANMNWFGVLAHHAERDGDRPMFEVADTSITYTQMLDRSVALAAGLREEGIRHGDVVALLSFNNIEFLEAIFAANYLGAAAMPINWRLAAAEVTYILDHSNARILICDEGNLELAQRAVGGVDHELRVVTTAAVSDQHRSIPDLRRDGNEIAQTDVGPEDMHRLMYTSGTTGRPKGVMISHGNLAWKNYAHLVEFGLTSSDIGLACGPLYHVGALDLTTTTLVAAGGRSIIHERFDASEVVAEIERSRVTAIWLAPAMVNAIMALEGIEARNLSSVRLIIAGGEKMPVPLIERIGRVFPSAWFADAYGLTETVSGDTFLDRASTLRKLGSVGKPCLYLDVQIWDDAGERVPAGQQGEIVLRGPKVFKGYWRDPEATARAFAGGWFHTGDIGMLDDDGYLYIVDRLKDMIVSGGENIASSEVERVLYEHPAVLEAAVVGRSHPKWGEVPVAFVVQRSGVDCEPGDILSHCRSQLAGYKTPKDVVMVDVLPRNPSGKVLKRELRQQLEEH